MVDNDFHRKAIVYIIIAYIVGLFKRLLLKGGLIMVNNTKYKVVYSSYITIKGRRIYAYQYGLKAFRFLVPINK